MKKNLIFFRSIPISILGMILVTFGWFYQAKDLSQKVTIGVFAGCFIAFLIAEIMHYFDSETNLRGRDLKNGSKVKVIKVITSFTETKGLLPWNLWNMLLLAELENGKQYIYRARTKLTPAVGEILDEW